MVLQLRIHILIYLFAQINFAQQSNTELDVVYNDLVWADEFNTNGAVSPINWFHQTQVLIPGVGWANGEQQHYTNRLDNAYVANGVLHIVAKRERYTDQGLTKEYTSARLNSKFAFTYGRVDVRAKLPEGAGTWPALWMLGKNINENGAYWDNQGFGTVNWPECGEIDIMEHGLDALNEISSALHTSCCHGGNPNKGTTRASDVATNYHVYSVNWSPDQIAFLLDNVIFFTYNPSVKNIETWPFFQEHYLLLNVAMGGAAGSIASNFVESSMLIDYVRVYQQRNALTIASEEEKKNSIQIHPNPVTHTLNITTNQIIEAVDLFTMSGKRLVVDRKSNTLNFSKLSTGIYLLKIKTTKGMVIRKVQKL